MNWVCFPHHILVLLSNILSFHIKAPPPQRLPSNLALSTNLQILSPLYDLTPPSNITAVVTEVGLIPPSSVPTVLVGRGLNQGNN